MAQTKTEVPDSTLFQSESVATARWKMKKVAAAEPLGLMLEQDQPKQARAVWQVEQRAEASKDMVSSREAVG